MTYVALTVYDVRICRELTDRESVAQWIEEESHRFPGSRVIRVTATGAKRTIWPVKPRRS